MASIWTNRAAFLVMSGGVDLDTTSGLKHGILKNGYTPDKDHNFISDVVAQECSAGGYTGAFGGAGRKTLASRTVTEDDTNDRGVFDAADPSAYTLAAGNTLRYSFIAQEVTTDADSPLLFILDWGADQVTNGGTVTVQFHANGIAYIQC